MVMREFKAVNGLAHNQEQHAKENQERELQAKQDQQERNPGKCGFHFADNRPWRSAYQAVKIFLPAFPHRAERSVHPCLHQAVAGAEPNPVARLLDAQRNRDVFQNFASHAAVAVNGIVRIAADQQKLPVRRGYRRSRIVHSIIRESLRQPQIDEGNESFSYQLRLICSGEKETSAVFCSRAICSARATELGACFASASVNKSHGLVACCTPTERAWFLRNQPSGKSFVSISRSSGISFMQLR